MIRRFYLDIEETLDGFIVVSARHLSACDELLKAIKRRRFALGHPISFSEYLGTREIVYLQEVNNELWLLVMHSGY